MSDKPIDPTTAEQEDLETPSISDILRVTPVLPGEPEDAYQAGLAAMVEELEAKTVLQVYIVEKIYDCLWWIRRYEDQKRITIINEMARLTKVGYKPEKTQAEVDIREAFMANHLSAGVMKALGALGHTPDSLRQEAFSKKREEIMQLDQQIALQAKILAGFQGSYEVAFNRKLNVERLKLQNELMRRDLAAIDVVSTRSKDSALDVRAIEHDQVPSHQSTKARRKSR
jgi:hypothetical protein